MGTISAWKVEELVAQGFVVYSRIFYMFGRRDHITVWEKDGITYQAI
jgi:hypothetical protein